MSYEELMLSLRERALRAYEERERARLEELDEAFYDLECETEAFCQSKLGFSPEGFERKTFTYQGTELPRLHFTADGLEFKAGFRMDPITINQSGKNVTVGHDRVFFLEVNGTVWAQVTSLADIGQVIPKG